MRAIFSLLILLSCFLSPPARAVEPPAPNVTPILEPEKQGTELALRLRSAVPPEKTSFTGELVITTRDDKTTSVPVTSTVTPCGEHASVLYQTRPAVGAQPEALSIIHRPGGSNFYSFSVVTNASALPDLTTNSHKPDITRPFAGSDFWLCDLGLEFLHWPQQRVLRHEMRRSRSCWVLESVTPTPAPGGYARVVSWVDVEHDGILRAEAFDKAGKLMKEFTLGSLRKIDGRYQLESMKMRNVRTGRESEIKFDLPK